MTTDIVPTHPAQVLQQQYAGRLAALVPSHVNGEAWVRQATGTLRDDDLARAAQSDFGSFIAAVERAAVLGLRPGSEEFYLVPRKKKGRLQVLGIVGYQGLVDLMYRSGAVASVVVETVHENDGFDYVPGQHDRPIHRIDWRSEDRGALVLVYAYAVMVTGAVSKVVVLNRRDIATIKASSDGADSPYSPWQKHPEAMWRKSAARQLAKWIPTSTEYLRGQTEARHVATRDLGAVAALDDQPAIVRVDAVTVDTTTGEVVEDAEYPAEWGEQDA